MITVTLDNYRNVLAIEASGGPMKAPRELEEAQFAARMRLRRAVDTGRRALVEIPITHLIHTNHPIRRVRGVLEKAGFIPDEIEEVERIIWQDDHMQCLLYPF